MLKGDFKKLGQLAKNLEKLASVPDRIAPTVSKELSALLQKQFDTGTNPYGRPWASLAKSTLAKGRTPPPLTDSRAMRNSAAFFPLPGQGVGGFIGFPGPIHQAGSPKTNLPARQIFPAGTFPKEWRAVLDDAARKAITETIMRGVA